MVFVDDSADEIKEAQVLLPNLLSIHFSPYTIYQELSCFKIHRFNSAQSLIRTESYRAKVLEAEGFGSEKTDIHLVVCNN